MVRLYTFVSCGSKNCSAKRHRPTYWRGPPSLDQMNIIVALMGYSAGSKTIGYEKNKFLGTLDLSVILNAWFGNVPSTILT